MRASARPVSDLLAQLQMRTPALSGEIDFRFVGEKPVNATG
jgi:hypothetical protein